MSQLHINHFFILIHRAKGLYLLRRERNFWLHLINWCEVADGYEFLYEIEIRRIAEKPRFKEVEVAALNFLH